MRLNLSMVVVLVACFHANNCQFNGMRGFFGNFGRDWIGAFNSYRCLCLFLAVAGVPLSAARGFTTTPFTVVRAREGCFVDLISIIEFTDERRFRNTLHSRASQN